MTDFSVKDALAQKAPTREANTYGIRFLEFRVRDMDTHTILFHMDSKRGQMEPKAEERSEEERRDDMRALVQQLVEYDVKLRGQEDDRGRFVPYVFGESFLKRKRAASCLVFRADEDVRNFRMIERHYGPGKEGPRLLHSFDFAAPFCRAGAENSWEFLYELPHLSSSQVELMVNHPYETQADSFYFVDDKLVMHHKAFFRYSKGK